jgi:hypothetical protein
MIFFYHVASMTSKPRVQWFNTMIWLRYTHKGITIIQTLYDIHESIYREKRNTTTVNPRTNPSTPEVRHLRCVGESPGHPWFHSFDLGRWVRRCRRIQGERHCVEVHVRFWRIGYELQHSDVHLEFADNVSLTFPNQKNGIKDDLVTHQRTGDALFCPVKGITIIQTLYDIHESI